MPNRSLRALWMLCLGLAACAPAARPAQTTPEPRLTVEELLSIYAANCEGPEGTTACDTSAHFEETFRDELPAMRVRREALVAAWMRSLEGGAHAPAYGLAWAGERRALPALRRGLLADRSFYGWESSDATTPEARMRDEQYPSQTARIVALEKLGGGPVREVVSLTPTERASLVLEAFAPADPGGPSDVARWLLVRLAPDALALRSIAPASPAEPAAVAPGLSGFLVTAHAVPQHDFALLARIGQGRIEAVDQKIGCRVLHGAHAFGTDPARGAPIALGATTFSNAANACLAPVDGLAKGDFVATIGLHGAADPATLDPETRALVQGLALEALARVRGADPVDFVGAADVSAVRYPGGVRAVVAVGATRRGARDLQNDPGPPPPACLSALCSVRPWEGVLGTAASLVAVYDLPDDRSSPRERTVIASSGGGCGPEQDDVVRFTGFASIPGAEPFVVVSRTACDEWHYELHAFSPTGSRLVAIGARGSRS